MVFKPRSGKQCVIAAGDWRAVITEQGASLRTLQWKGKDLIVPFAPDKLVPCCNGWILTPYPNRVTDGSYTFNGVTYQMPIDEPDRQTALHGYSYRYMWKLEDLQENQVTMSWRTPNLAGYPFDITVTATYVLSEEGLTQTVSVHNNDSVEAPWAYGIHPWLANGGNATGDAIQDDNDLCSLELHCNKHVTVDERLLPTGEEPVEGTRFDLHGNPKLKNLPFDDAWTDVERDSQGKTKAVFTRPDGIAVTLTGDNTINAWQVCTGTGFPEATHQAGVAVEPMTAYADAFRSGKDLVVVAPGADYSTTITYTAKAVDVA